MRTYCKPRTVTRFYENYLLPHLTPPHKKWIYDLPFSHLLSFHDIIQNQTSLNEILQLWDDDMGAFVFKGKAMRFGSRDVAVIMGLRSKRYPGWVHQVGQLGFALCRARAAVQWAVSYHQKDVRRQTERSGTWWIRDRSEGLRLGSCHLYLSHGSPLPGKVFSCLSFIFSFYLGACLSEMTFPRRQLIRHSASLASADSLVCFTSTETQLLLEVPKWIA